MKNNFLCNEPLQNIFRLFKVLAYFLFTTSETERDYYQRKLNVRVALRVAKQLKTLQNDEI